MKNNPKLAELQARHAEQIKELERESTIIATLPDDLPDMPTISNIKQNPKPLEPHAWLSFSGPSYDPDKKYSPLAILQSLERSGWRAAPATLCKWNNYRHAAYPGLQASIPPTMQEYDKRELKSAEAIAPLWVRPCQHTQPEIECFMTGPDDKLYRLAIGVPGIACVSARRVEFPGGWRFESGTGRLGYPAERWNALEVCTVSINSRAYVDTEQGVSGAIYFTPRAQYPQEQWPLTLSAFLELLLTK